MAFCFFSTEADIPSFQENNLTSMAFCFILTEADIHNSKKKIFDLLHEWQIKPRSYPGGFKFES